MQGRKPLPTHLKLVKGERRTSRINQKEPKPVTGSLRLAPSWFTEDQKEIWRYAIKHAPPGLLKKIDASVLAIWVVAKDTHQKAAEALAKSSLLYKTKNGEAMQNPYLPVINKQALLMLRAAAEMGFTPSSRSRISIDGYGEKQPQDPLEKYL